MTVNWAWYLARSSDFSKIGLLAQAQNKQITLALNDRESANFSLSLLDPLASQISPVTTCILCYRNNQLVWSGPIFTMDKSAPDLIGKFGCLGWFEFFNHWLLHTGNLAPPGGWNTMGTMTATTLSYPATGLPPLDQCAIIADLINLYAQDTARDGGIQWVTLGNVPNTSLGALNGTRTITYQEYQNLGQAITNMSQIEFGFDFRVDPATKMFNMYFNPIWPIGSVNPNDPRVTAGLAQAASVNGRGQYRPNAIFGYHWGPANVGRLQETTDATQLVNKAFAVSQYGTGAYADSGSISKYGVFNEQVQITDSATIDNDILTAYALVEVLTKKDPLRIWQFDQMAYSPQASALQPFGVDFDIGDYCWLVSDYGIIIPGPNAGIAGKMPIRIFAYDVTISNEGVETVTNVQCTFQQQA